MGGFTHGELLMFYEMTSPGLALTSAAGCNSPHAKGDIETIGTRRPNFNPVAALAVLYI